MAVNLSPIGNDAPFLDASGNPLNAGLLYTYVAGSAGSTAATTYTTSAGNVQNANPIVLNSNGYPASGGNVVSIWLTAGVSYLFILKTSAGVTVWSRDNINGINDTSVTIDQWVSGPAPTYVSATSFTLVGDQTSTFHVGRRVKTTNSGGTIYSTITASAFAALSTITVVNDSGTLDSGLSAVSYGLLSTTNPSTPILTDAYPIVSGSADKTKKVRLEADGLTTATTRVLTVQDQDMTLGLVLGTEQPTTSGTSIDFTSIPAWVKRITIQFVGVSTNGADNWLVQIGDSGGIENSGYLGSAAGLTNAAAVGVTNYTAGFGIPTGGAGNVGHGTVVLTLEDSTQFTWVANGQLALSDSAAFLSLAGSKSLSAALDRVRITTTGGANTFDAGAVNVLYE